MIQRVQANFDNRNSSNKNSSDMSNISFKGLSTRELGMESKFTPKVLKLIKDANELIETTWTKIKKGKSKLKSPEFSTRLHQKEATLKPVYNTSTPSMQLEVTTDKNIQRIVIERNNPKDIFYEKRLKTPAGSVTTRTYRSELGDNPELNQEVNAILETYMPYFVPDRKMSELLKP